VFEESMTGSRADRPQLAAALAFARDGDVLVVARLDRSARSLRQLLTTVDALKARGIGLRSLHENIDTTCATGRLILHIFAALGQFEVELLRERTRTALAASRARGRVGGRPSALDAIKVTAAKAMLASGTMTASEVALDRVQFLDLVSSFAGWTLGAGADRAVRCLISVSIQPYAPMHLSSILLVDGPFYHRWPVQSLAK
jgi:DNA invertase Pin-like site-specific DNA recombinase